MKRIKIGHGIYEPFKHVRGKRISVGNNRLTNLLNRADSALGRSEGKFFDTIDGQFVFGIEQNRTDEHSRNQSMAYFDVFVADVDDIVDLSLVDLRETLVGLQARSFSSEVDTPVKAEVATTDPQRSHTEHQSSSRGDQGTDQGDRSAGRGALPNEAEFLGEMWEQYRRPEMELHATLNEVERFTRTVDGALPNLSYVSRSEIEDVGFDIVGDDPLETGYARPPLVNRIESLRVEGKLRWETLPTYADELKQLRTEKRREILHDNDELVEDIRDLIKTIRSDIITALEAEANLAGDLFNQGAVGNIESNRREQGNITDRITAVFDDEREMGPLVSPDRTDAVDHEIVDSVDQQMCERTEEVLQHMEDEIVEEFQQELLQIVEDYSERLAQDVVDAIAEVRTSEEFRRVQEASSE